RGILQDIDEAEALTRSQDRQLEGLVRVHAPPVLATYVVAPLLAEFRRQFPKIRIDIDVEAATANLYETYDLTLIGRRSDFDADLVARKVVEARAILVASPRYLQTHGVPREPAELIEHETLMLRVAAGERQQWTLWREDGDEPPLQVDVDPGLCSNHSDTLLRAALDGAGITSVTGDIVASYLNDGQLVRVLESWSSGRLAMYAVLPSRRFVPQRTRVFLEYLIEETRHQVTQAGMLPGLEHLQQRR
ncbi:MAG: substrate binding domain-containing protein, partial [Pigmentiphaga sp.]